MELEKDPDGNKLTTVCLYKVCRRLVLNPLFSIPRNKLRSDTRLCTLVAQSFIFLINTSQLLSIKNKILFHQFYLMISRHTQNAFGHTQLR